VGCSVAHEVEAPPDLEVDVVPASTALSQRCRDMVEASFDRMPEDLECAGLFSDVANQRLMGNVIEYAPSVALWSDNAEKRRWIALPPGMKIDNSDNANWQFPIGTKFFKEFGFEHTGPIETRMFWKEAEGKWGRTTYEWNDTRTGARRLDEAKDVDVGFEGIHHIPSGIECDTCHASQERVLGFEAVSLGTEGAEGLPLSVLVEKGLLTEEPPSLELEVGDDGTGKAEPVIRWLHINCGRSCHNDDQRSKAYPSRLFLRLDPAECDGRSANELNAVKSTKNVSVKTLQWADETRIVPGDPEKSWLYHLISRRGGGKNEQMPPIATNEVDWEHTMMVAEWIRAMKPESDPNGDPGTKPD
jgi:hypothetical protein